MQIYPSFKPFSLHPLPPGQDNQPFILNTSSASSNLSSVIEEGRTPLLFNCSIAKHSHKFIAERFVGSKATLFHSLSFSYAHQYHQERNVNCGIKRLRYNWQSISKQQATIQREREGVLTVNCKWQHKTLCREIATGWTWNRTELPINCARIAIKMRISKLQYNQAKRLSQFPTRPLVIDACPSIPLASANANSSPLLLPPHFLIEHRLYEAINVHCEFTHFYETVTTSVTLAWVVSQV